jgi:heme exporter protein C
MAAVVELIFVGYVIVRKFGGPGSDKLAAGVAIFGMFNVPFVYESSNLWRTIHPQTTVVTTLTQKAPGMSGPFWYCVTTFMLLFVLLLAARMKLEQERALLDELYLAEEDAAV